ncbi:MAG: hypothetical protein ACI8U1_002612, partial [Rheinheimera aquimaris]
MRAFLLDVSRWYHSMQFYVGNKKPRSIERGLLNEE